MLENETRVLSQRGLQRAMGIVEGGGRSGETRLETFVRKFGGKVPELHSLLALLKSPLEFRPQHRDTHTNCEIL